MPSLFEQIPGYEQAAQKENLVRDVSFLRLNEIVGGIEVKPLSLRLFIILRMMNSPLLTGATPTPAQLAGFLWVISSGYGPLRKVARWFFLQKCRIMFKNPLRSVQVVMESRDYMAETFQDAPAAGKPVECEKQYYSDAATACMTIAKEFGWSDEYVLDMPLKRLFQYSRILKQSNKDNAVLFNPSDRIISDWLREKNEKELN